MCYKNCEDTSCVPKLHIKIIILQTIVKKIVYKWTNRETRVGSANVRYSAFSENCYCKNGMTQT